MPTSALFFSSLCFVFLTKLSLQQDITFGDEFHVNENAIGTDNINQKVAALQSGKFVVVWHSETDIYLNLFHETGDNIFANDIIVHSALADYQQTPDVACLSNGRFVVVWVDENSVGDTYETGISGQLFNEDGSRYLQNFQVNELTEYTQWGSAVSALKNGNFIVAWNSYSPVTAIDIRARVFNPDGLWLYEEFQASTLILNDQLYSQTTELSNGNFVIQWQAINRFGTGQKTIWMQVFDPYTNKIGSEISIRNVTADDNEIKQTNLNGLPNGKFVFCYMVENQYTPSSIWDIYAVVFNPDGTVFKPEFLVNDITSGEQSYGDVIGLKDGRFIITWQGNNAPFNIFAKIFYPDALAFGVSFQINEALGYDCRKPYLAELTDKNIVIVWEEHFLDGSYGIIGRVISIPLYNASQKDVVFYLILAGGGVTTVVAIVLLFYCRNKCKAKSGKMTESNDWTTGKTQQYKFPSTPGTRYSSASNQSQNRSTNRSRSKSSGKNRGLNIKNNIPRPEVYKSEIDMYNDYFDG